VNWAELLVKMQVLLFNTEVNVRFNQLRTVLRSVQLYGLRSVQVMARPTVGKPMLTIYVYEICVVWIYLAVYLTFDFDTYKLFLVSQYLKLQTFLRVSNKQEIYNILFHKMHLLLQENYNVLHYTTQPQNVLKTKWF